MGLSATVLNRLRVCSVMLAAVLFFITFPGTTPGSDGNAGRVAPTSATGPGQGNERPATLRLGTFNIRMFPCNDNCACMRGFGYQRCRDERNPRTDPDRVASTIRELNPDILGLNEILEPSVLAKLASEKLGPEWRLVHAAHGSKQRVGFLYRDTVVTLKEQRVFTRLYEDLNQAEHHPRCFGSNLRIRPAFACRFEVKGSPLTFWAVVLHLKSGPCATVRAAQWKIMKDITDVLSAITPNIAVLGDFNNAGRKRREFDGFCDEKGYSLVTGNIPCTYLGIDRRKSASLDHILVSTDLLSRVVPDSAAAGGACRTGCGFNYQWENYLHRVSDHCPVVVDIQTGDN